MTTTPQASTAPAAPTQDAATAVDTTAVDTAAAVDAADMALHARARTTAEVLEGLLAAGTLKAAGTPDALPHLLWPDIDQAVVQRIWDTAAAVGYWAGLQKGSPRWKTDVLDEYRVQLRDAGYERMAKRVAATAYAAPSRDPHPADGDGPARGDH